VFSGGGRCANPRRYDAAGSARRRWFATHAITPLYMECARRRAQFRQFVMRLPAAPHVPPRVAPNPRDGRVARSARGNRGLRGAMPLSSVARLAPSASDRSRVFRSRVFRRRHNGPNGTL